jgi:hypothetical protein
MQKHPQSHPDKVNLINLMKDELDRVQTRYVANGSVIVYGALVEGLYGSVIMHEDTFLFVFVNYWYTGHRVKIYATNLKVLCCILSFQT